MAAEEFDIQKRYEKKKEEERKKEKGIVEDKKKIVQIIKLEVMAGAAKPGPPIGPVLGQHQLNTAEFCKEFNRLTDKISKDVSVPVLIYKKADKTFDIKLRNPTTSFYRIKFEKNTKNIKKGKFSSKEAFAAVVGPKIDVLAQHNSNKEFGFKNFKSVLSSLRSAKMKFYK